MQALKTIRTAMWLDYQIMANWTRPIIFFTYNIAKPVGSSLLLIAMYYVVTGRVVGSAALSFLFVGNAFYMILAQVMMSLGWVVHDDREHYQTLKYIYISPSSYYVYLVGRAAMRFLMALFPAFFLLLLGLLIPIPYAFNYPLLAFTLLFGWLFMVASGMLLNSVNLLTARHGGAIGEAFAGVFYLFSGVVFPVSMLPAPLQVVAMYFPSTYWFSLVRRSVLGVEVDGIMKNYTINQCVLLLAITTGMFIAMSIALYLTMDHLARKRGTVEMITTY